MCALGLLNKIFGPPDPEKLKAKRDIEGLLKLRATPQLISFLNDPELKVRLRVLDALAEIGDKSSVNSIFNLLRVVTIPMDNSLRSSIGVSIRKRAVEVLDQMEWQPSSDEEKILYNLVKGQKDQCVGLGAHIIPLLRKVYEEKIIYSNVFHELIQKFDISEAIQPLIELLIWAIRNNDKIVRIATIFTLIKIGEPVKEPLNRALLSALKSGDNAFADGGALTILAAIGEKGRESGERK